MLSDADTSNTKHISPAAPWGRNDRVAASRRYPPSAGASGPPLPQSRAGFLGKLGPTGTLCEAFRAAQPSARFRLVAGGGATPRAEIALGRLRQVVGGFAGGSRGCQHPGHALVVQLIPAQIGCPLEGCHRRPGLVLEEVQPPYQLGFVRGQRRFLQRPQCHQILS